MSENQDLGLSLSLSTTTSTSVGTGTGNGSSGAAIATQHSSVQDLQLNLMPSSPASASASPAPFFLQKSTWPPSSDRSSEMSREAGAVVGETTRSFLRGIDVNRIPSAVDCEDEGGVSSPNSTISSISGKRSEREPCNGDDNDLDRSCSRGISDEEDADGSRKKLRLSKDQSATLEESFKENNTLNPKQKLALAKQLGLRPRQVEVWFQNRRARTKLKQTEVDCEFLKRCCENLTEENRRLQKEVHELRAIKLSPQFYMQMAPPTTLTMCPSCERVAVASTAGGSASAASGVDPHYQRNHVHHHHRGGSVNPWGNAPVQHRLFDAAPTPRS